jgi:toxin co-regulated pilus biosynthesis protein E
VVIVAACLVLVYLNQSVFPQFAAIKPIAAWPTNGQQLVALANFLQSWWFIVIALIAGTFIGFAYVLKNVVGDLRRSFDQIIPFTIYRQLAAARFMETLGLLISNGVVFKQALKILQQQASPYLMWHLIMMELRLGRGRGNIAEVLDTGLISDDDIVRLKAIADAKGFEHALIRLGKAAGVKGIQTVRKVGRILGGLFLMIAAGFAGFMIMGLYSVGSSLS